MKNKSLMLLLVAVGCGLVAMFGVQQMLSSGPATKKTRILVSRSDIEPGVQLDKTNVGFKEWPAEAVPEGAIQTEEEFAERALKHRVGPGQPILSTALGNKGEFGTEIQIPADMRVVTVAVTATMTHSGLLRPGNYVDVSAVIDMPIKGGGRRSVVKPVLQCVQVFAVDKRTVGSEDTKDAKAADGKNVSFLVYPLQGQLLQLAFKQSAGNLQFALRSGADKNLANMRDLSDESLSMLANSLMENPDEPQREKVAEKTTSTPAVTAKPKSAFQSYLSPETPSAVTSVGDKAVKRTWKIEIFQGDHREVQEIEWPEETKVESKRTSTEASQPWANPLMKFFDRRQKAEQPVETQSTSLIRKKSEASEAEAGEEAGAVTKE